MKKLLLLSLFIASSSLALAEDTDNISNEQDINKRTPIKSQSFSRKKIYETKYFKIYYDKNSIDATKKLIEVADNIAEIEAKFMKMELPKKKIKLYVEDARDDDNAYSTGNGIHLYINNISNVTTEFKSWIPYLFSHELTHELLSYKIKGTGFNRFIPLSDEMVNHAAVSRWWTEGMAVLMESMISGGGGRTFDPIFLSIAKRDITEDKFNGLGPSPGYNKVYQYGNSFLKFYLDTYGIEKSSEAIDYYAHHKLTNIGEAYAIVAQTTGEELYKKWQDYLKVKVDEKQLVEGGIVLNEDSELLQIIKDDKDIYLYSVKKDEVRSKLLGVDLNKIVLSKIELDYYGNLKKKEDLDTTFSSIGEIAILDGFAYYAVTKKSSIKGQLDNVAYKVDLDKGSSKYLKDVKRATNFVAVDKKIYYSFNENTTQGISTLDGDTIIPSGTYQIQSMIATNDGKILVTAHTEGNMGTQIYEVDPKTKTIKFVVNGSDPYKVGNSLYYVNNYGDDQNNIYKTTIGSATTTKLTNVKYNASKPLEINGKLFYANYAQNGYQLTRLSPEEQLKTSTSIASLDSKKQKRYDTQLNLYGDYGKEYQSYSKTTISKEILEENNKKEIAGFFLPTFSKPQISFDTGSLSLISRSSNDKDIFLFNVGATHEYNSKQNQPVFSFDSDSDKKKQASYMAFNTIVLHHFSEPTLSKSLILWSHTQKKATNDIAKKSKNNLSEDQLILQVPFRSDNLNMGFNVTTSVQGDFFGGDEKYQKSDTSFGIGDYDTGFLHKSLLTLGTTQKSNKVYNGSYATDTYYADSNLGLFLPFLSELSFFSLNARVEYAPKEFSSDSRVSPSLLDSPKLNGENNVAIRNTYTTTNVYGDFKYLYQINHSSSFGKIYTTGILFKLGYSVVNYKDNDYNQTKQSAYVVGAGVDPSITLMGNIFNDSGSFELGLGHSFVNNFANGSIDRDDKSYLVIRLAF